MAKSTTSPTSATRRRCARPARGEAPMRSGYRVELAQVSHAGALPAIELAAATLFPEEDLPASLREQAIPVSMYREAAEAGRLWVAVAESGEPVGFAIVTIVDGCAHVFELDVHPAHGRRGLGTRLLRAVADWAAARGYPAVTLTTFRHLPWNAPFYARFGFREIPEARLGPELRALFEQEVARGLERTKRVVMRLAVSRPPV
ncbi:MAG TPA: GNAT family N-acetyltransferase [Candidatus Eisenbacteria bacterium]